MKDLYLIVLRHSSDDLPLFLTDDADEARAFAMRASWDDGQQDQDIVNDTSWGYASTPICFTLYVFRGGFVVKTETLRSWDAEQPGGEGEEWKEGVPAA